MEFYRELQSIDTDVRRLQALLSIAMMPELCDSIDSVLSDSGDAGEIYCLWGQFTVGRENIRHGVRYSLSSCPHALAWTITREDPDRLVIHCTINDTRPEQEFIDSIGQFVEDWASGLSRALDNAAGAPG